MDNQKQLSLSQNALYNTIGTILYCFCQWLLSSLLVVHLSPDNIAVSNTGLLQLAISITNIFFAISCYNIHTYQISDTKNVYSTGDYVGLRCVTASIAVLLCIVYVVVLGYPAQSILCIMLYMLFKLTETFCDVFHAIDQKNYRMDYVGISYGIRGIVSVIAFAAALALTGNVLTAILVMALSSIAVVVVYDMKRSATFGSIKPVFHKKTILALLITCFPAVIASASFTAITTIPRQILEGMQGKEALGYYGTIATPVVVVQIMATSIFNPMLTELSYLYDKGNIRKFLQRTRNNLLILLGLTVFTFLGVLLLGKFAVGLLFGAKFVPYTSLMYGIICCTSLYVVSWLCTSILIIMRRLKVCMVASLVSLLISSATARAFITAFGMNGVSISIVVAYLLHIAICCVVIAMDLRQKR